MGVGGAGFVRLVEEAVENDEVVILRNEAGQAVVLFEETDKLLGGAVVGEFFGEFGLCPEELFEDFLRREMNTLPMPVRWQVSCT